MTLMLASVLSVEEAETALAHGADIIDCKDPHRGALGALPLARITEIVASRSAPNNRCAVPGTPIMPAPSMLTSAIPSIDVPAIAASLRTHSMP